MESFTFHNPTRMMFGPGMIENLGEEAKPLGKRALLVTGKSHAKKSGILDRVKRLLENAGLTVVELTGIDPNPRIGSAREGIRLCKEHALDMVIALGGGSVMDISKVIAAGVSYDRDPWDMTRPRQAEAPPPTTSLPTIMIPTMAATGSEMNAAAVISNPDTTEKCAAVHPCFYPTVSIADPELTCTVPPDHTAYGIVDTIAHVLETYFNGCGDTPLQDRMQEGIVLTTIAYGPRAMANGDDLEARTQLQWASIIALNGWTHTGTDGSFPVHQIEHVVSAHYDIAHASGLSILFPAFMKTVSRMQSEKYVQFAERVFGIASEGRDAQAVAADGIQCLESFFREIGAPVRFSEVGIKSEKFDRMCDDVVRLSGKADGLLPANPPLTKAQIREVLDTAQ